MLVSPFGPEVAFAWRWIDAPLEYQPPAEELRAIGESWAARRRIEYLQGRSAAAEALGLLGARAPVPRGSSGEPLWPTEIVGAITHTRGLAAAAAGRREHHLGLGIDLEPVDRSVSREVSRLICTPAERSWVDEDGAVGAAHRPGLRLKLIFSAKESVFKATCPHAGIHLGYQDAELQLEADGLRGVLLRDAGPALPSGTVLAVGFRVLELGPRPEAPGPERSGSYLLTHLAIPVRS